MSGSTDRLGLYLAGGGSSEEFEDETIDIDRQNSNFEDIDAAVGAPGFTSSSRPATPFDGQLIWETDTGLLKRWSDDDSEWASMQSTPTGVLNPYGGATAPDGWLLCDGAAISRTSYAALFAVLGTAYGEGDGSSTFNLPNAKGKSLSGLDSTQTEFNTLGGSGGAKTHTLTTAEMPAHSHGVTYSNGASSLIGGGSGADANASGSGGYSIKSISINSAGSGAAHNNLPPYLVVNYIIKF